MTDRDRGETGLKFQPYWWEAAPRSSDVIELPKKCDVLVVGSGYTGLSAALTLLNGGRGVVVLDRGCPGFWRQYAQWWPGWKRQSEVSR